MRNFVVLISVIFGLLVAGCKTEPPAFDSTPVISLLNYGPLEIEEFIDSVYFTIQFEDGDGDLGENNSEVENLFVRDNRIGIEYGFRIGALVPGNANVPIKGDISFYLENTNLVGSGQSEDVNYSIWAVDRAGHSSNLIEVPTLKIIKP